jgi:two-component system CheB/CheR fusion protein
MPDNSGMAFVLVPHLDPTHKSLIGELLGKNTGMEISQAEDGMKVLPNSVYIIPPDKNIAILHGTLQLIEPAERRGLRHPIDYFFRTLAEDQGEHAICIILSGTGTEGTLGLKSVKGTGGLVVVQDTESAKYDGMPRSAIDTGLVDYILSPDKMPYQLLNYINPRYRKHVNKPVSPAAKIPDALQKIFIIIRNHTGHDFTNYKLNTITRRIERRMTLHQIDNIMDYVTYLRDNPDETNMLFRELLIRVTNFFRDTKAFDVLRNRVIPELFKNSSEDLPLRVWVPGCCTGEEAYSIAIEFYEYMRTLEKRTAKVQIFATDIDGEAIEIARNGMYPESISVDVSADYLKRYFVKEGNTCIISRKIREMVVFATQNIIKDPPFSKVDLISCRNLLIYLGPQLQKKLMPVFHYALNPDGILFLGSSESIGSFSDLFSVFNNKWKMYKPKQTSVSHLELDYPPVTRPLANEQAVPEEPVTKASNHIADLIERKLLESYSPSCLVVDENGSILHFHGRTGNYLEPSPGKARLNIFDMAREGLKTELRTGIRKTAGGKTDTVYKGLKVRSNGFIHIVDLSIRRLHGPDTVKGLLMVVFEEKEPVNQMDKVKGLPEKRDRKIQKVADLEFELKSTREQLQTTIEELEASNEELQSTNEELQSANEELQSTNEELETSREELQSVNEELMTVNAEAQVKIDELTKISNDLNNLMAGTDVATVFLNIDLKIKRFTPSVTKVINLIQSDMGRPISDISTTLKKTDLEADAEEVLKTLMTKSEELQDKNGDWYLMRILPYRTFENVIDGVVITFNDITFQKKTQDRISDLLSYSESVVNTVREPLLVLDSEYKVVMANRSFYKKFKVLARDTIGCLVYKLGNRQWNIPELRQLLEDILPGNTKFDNFKVEHVFPNIGKKTMMLNARKVVQKGAGESLILLAIEDVTLK